MRISDWSSDVCSSDPFDEATAVLGRDDLVDVIDPGKPAEIGDPRMRAVEQPQLGLLPRRDILRELNAERSEIGPGRSEERRVGKECVSTCSSRWSPDH